jgi:cytoskeletal protein RodZ
MRSLGNTIKDKRAELTISLADLERETRIRKEFLNAIENAAWENLPEYPVVQGFVRSIAHVLDMDEELSLALLRRDYPRKDIRITPKPDVKNKFIWSPKWTLLAGVLFVSLIIVGYLGYQYKQFVSPPTLTINNPTEDEVITKSIYTVTGKTSEDATVIINNQPTLINDDGTFTEEVEISKDTKEITIKATSRAGKVTEIKRKVKVEL